MNIPFLDLKAIHNEDISLLKKTAEHVLDSGWFVLGEQVKAFELEWASYCQSKYAIGVASGLDAIELILRAENYPEGSEILVPANTYFATILGVLKAGYKPVLVDPNPTTFLMDVNGMVAHVSDKTVAVFFVELYGAAGDYAALTKFCAAKKLDLFSDNAQSHGATYRGKPTATYVKAAAYSFYPSKNLGAIGDAGAVVTSNAQLAEKINALRNYGSEEKYVFEYLGLNSRLDELQAAFLLVKLKTLGSNLEKRRAIANAYLNQIKNDRLTLPNNKNVESNAWHLFILQCGQRDELQHYLRDRGIGTDIHYPIPPYKQNALKGLALGSFPVADRLHRNVLSIPLNSSLTTEEVNYIISTLNHF